MNGNKFKKVSREFNEFTEDPLNKTILTAYNQQLTRFVFRDHNYEIVSIRKKGHDYIFKLLRSKHYERDRSSFARFS